jgi:hypothetical protein
MNNPLEQLNRTRFIEQGMIKLEDLLPSQPVSMARERIYSQLSRLGLLVDGRWADSADPAWGKPARKALKGLSKSQELRGLISDRVITCAQTLVDGEAIASSPPDSQLLYTPPGAGTWTVPHAIWHLDYPRLGEQDGPGVQMFTFLDTVTEANGGTLLISGSHRLLNDEGVLSSKETKRRLKRHAFFRNLLDKHYPERDLLRSQVANIDGTELKLVELTGKPGDVYLTDLRLLHSLGANTCKRPRLMMTQRFLRASVASRLVIRKTDPAAT